MAVTEIPWGDGTSDKIYLTYSDADGNQEVLVTSDPNAGEAMAKTITFRTAGGEVSRNLTVFQEHGSDFSLGDFNNDFY